ncbi:unnamed protein product, partial [Prunus brigantina]
MVSTATGSPAFTFSAHRPSESLVVMKDGPSKRFRYEDFAPPEGDDGGMDQPNQIPSMPYVNFKDKLLSYSCFEYSKAPFGSLNEFERKSFPMSFSKGWEIEDSFPTFGNAGKVTGRYHFISFP